MNNLNSADISDGAACRSEAGQLESAEVPNHRTPGAHHAPSTCTHSHTSAAHARAHLSPEAGGVQGYYSFSLSLSFSFSDIKRKP